ncbi:unnamed protein product [Closterium sp. NIES-53]
MLANATIYGCVYLIVSCDFYLSNSLSRCNASLHSRLPFTRLLLAIMNILVTGPPGVGKTTLIIRVMERVKEAIPSLTLRGFTTEEVRRDGERIGFDVVTMEGARMALARVLPSEFPSPLHTSTAADEDRKSRGSGRWGRVGKYTVDVASVDLHVLPLLSLASTLPPSLPSSSSSSLVPHVPTTPPVQPQSQPQSQTRSESQPSSAASPPEAASLGTFNSSSSPRGTLWVVDEIGKMELLSTRFAAAVTALLDAPLPLLASIPVPTHGKDLPQVAAIRARPDVSLVEVSRSNRDRLVPLLTDQLLALIGSGGRRNP